MKLKSRTLAPVLGAMALLVLHTSVLASFEARSLDGNPADAEAWYDTVAGLTWLKDVGANATNAGLYPGSTNTSSMSAAESWAAGLVYGASSDWRLPTLTEAQNLQAAGFLSSAHFDGMGAATGPLWNQAYMWTATDLTPGFSRYILGISGAAVGVVDAAVADRGFQVFGVAAGDFGQALAPVPEPSTYLLMGLGLLGLAFARRRAA